ncbi:MAG TPA: DNA-3-methyladenine glycosylase [Vulgatibacter sp.]|nr:DNA-3-methyladenine glycosylase [Vulgatibacter sp.]
MAHPLPREFYDRDTLQVARSLIGCTIHRRVGRRTLVGRIVETEAYVGPEDLACHASKGRTRRTEPMFGPPGHAYVYFIYGLHHCFNAVTEGQGSGTAVLVRAVEPISGFSGDARTNGPARLTKAMAIDRGLDRLDLTLGEELWLEEASRPVGSIESGRRIGVDYAGEWAARPYRFWEAKNPWVSVLPRRKAPVVEATVHRTSGKDRPRR